VVGEGETAGVCVAVVPVGAVAVAADTVKVGESVTVPVGVGDSACCAVAVSTGRAEIQAVATRAMIIPATNGIRLSMSSISVVSAFCLVINGNAGVRRPVTQRIGW
jgi:hypothetical protein